MFHRPGDMGALLEQLRRGHRLAFSVVTVSNFREEVHRRERVCAVAADPVNHELVDRRKKRDLS
jgi:hypothetical protein